MSLYDDENLPHLCDVYKTTRVRESRSGTAVKTPVLVSTAVKCWEQAASASEVKLYLQRGYNISRKVYFNFDIRSFISERCMIVVTHRQNGDGDQEAVPESDREYYDVMSLDEPDSSAGYGILWKAMLSNSSSDRSPV